MFQYLVNILNDKTLANKIKRLISLEIVQSDFFCEASHLQAEVIYAQSEVVPHAHFRA